MARAIPALNILTEQFSEPTHFPLCFLRETEGEVFPSSYPKIPGNTERIPSDFWTTENSDGAIRTAELCGIVLE